jgi:hypothetical protein
MSLASSAHLKAAAHRDRQQLVDFSSNISSVPGSARGNKKERVRRAAHSQNSITGR